MFNKNGKPFPLIGDVAPNASATVSSSSYSPEALLDLERRKRALVDELAQIAAEITAAGIDHIEFPYDE